MSEHVRHVAIQSGFLMVLRQGDDVFARLEELMLAEGIPSASITGFGFVSHVRFGYFDFERGDYDPRDFADLEITGLTGALAWMEGRPSIHAHATGADGEFTVVGGHALSMVVGRGSFEITIVVHPLRLERIREPSIGANVLQLAPRVDPEPPQ